MSARRPSGTGQPGTVRSAATGDDRRDTDRVDLLTVLVVAVGAIGEHRVRSSPRPATVLPPVFLSPDYYYPEWAALGLDPLLPGFEWVRYGPDLLLVDLNTGEVVDGVYGAFDMKARRRERCACEAVPPGDGERRCTGRSVSF